MLTTYIKCIILVFLFLGKPVIVHSQNEASLLSRLHVSEITIEGFEFKKGSTSNHLLCKEVINRQGLIDSFQIIKASKYSQNNTGYNFTENGRIKTSIQTNYRNDTLYTFIEIKDKFRRQKIQLSRKKDTLNSQIWTTNNKGQNLLLKRRIKEKYFDQIAWSYDNKGQVISKDYYDNSGVFEFKESYHYKAEDKCIIQLSAGERQLSKVCTYQNRIEYHYLKSQYGSFFGIQLKLPGGGKKVEYLLSNGLIERIEYVSKSNIVLSQIKYSYKY